MTASLFGCGTGTPFESNVSIVSNNPELTPGQIFVDQEAIDAALWMSGELTVPMSLARSLEEDLLQIRQQWGDSIENCSIGFRTPWEAGKIVIGFDDATYASVLEGTYTAWDSLNAVFGVLHTSHDDYHASLNWSTVYFLNEINPTIACAQYENLPGVRFATPNRFVGDGPIMIPWPGDDGTVYFFKNAWGDCLSGCIYAEFDLFEADSTGMKYVGYYPNLLLVPIEYRTLWGRAMIHYQI